MITYGEYFKRRANGETVKGIAESIGSNTKALNRALNAVGYVSEGKGATQRWIWQGEGVEPLEQELVFGRVTTQKPNTNERKNVVTNEGKNIRTNESNNVGTKEQTKVVVRKRASFDIDVDLLKELKVQAVLQDKNVYEMVEQAIRKYLREDI